MYGIFTASLLHLVPFVSVQAGQVDCRNNLLTREQNTEQYEAEPVRSRHRLVFHKGQSPSNSLLTSSSVDERVRNKGMRLTVGGCAEE